MMLGITFIIAPVLVLSLLALAYFRAARRIRALQEQVIALDARVAERSGDVIRLGKTILRERAQIYGGERAAALGRE